MGDDEKSTGQVNFEAYCAERGGKNHDGTATPKWEDLGDGVRAGWEAGARATLAHAHALGPREKINSARAMMENAPRSREAALVITKLDEARMWLDAIPMESREVEPRPVSFTPAERGGKVGTTATIYEGVLADRDGGR